MKRLLSITLIAVLAGAPMLLTAEMDLKPYQGISRIRPHEGSGWRLGSIYTDREGERAPRDVRGT